MDGVTAAVDGETYIFDHIEWHNYEGAFDWVDIIFVSQQGSTGGSLSARDGRVRKAGDEEWELECQVERMTAGDALTRGFIESLSDISEVADLSETTMIDMPIPTLVRRNWTKGVKNKRPLPAKIEEAVAEWGGLPLTGIIDLGNHRLRLMSTRATADGNLLVTTRHYERIHKK